MSSPGNHCALNCNVKNSKSLMVKGCRYGIEVSYNEDQIRFFYISLFGTASEVLETGGYLLVKLMDTPEVKLTSFVKECAAMFGYDMVREPQEFTAESTGSVSFLHIYQRSGVAASDEARQQFIWEYREKAMKRYLHCAKLMTKERVVFTQGLNRVLSYWEGQRQLELFQRIRNDYPAEGPGITLLESSRLIVGRDGVVRDGIEANVSTDTDIEGVQRFVATRSQSTLALKNVFAIAFVSLLDDRDPDSTFGLKDKVAVMKDVGFSEDLVKKLFGAKVGLDSVVDNVKELRLFFEKQRAKTKKDRSEALSANCLRNFLGV